MKDILIKDCRLFQGERLKTKDILIRDQKIHRIARRIKIKDAKIIEAKKRLLSAGFIDAHSHWREPGFSNKETILSGSKAAAKGGFTTALLMANLNPVPDRLTSLKKQLKIIKTDSIITAIPYGSITKNQGGQEVSDIEEMKESVIGYSDDGKAIQDSGIMFEAMQRVRSVNKLIASHCEDYSVSKDGHISNSDMAKILNINTIDPLAESKQLARDIELVRRSKCRYHLCHISNSLSVNLIKLAKKEGLKITCEVTPHHLISSSEDIKEDDGNWKMKPPLASKKDQEILVEAIKEGVIDIIATDHAPHTKEEKNNGIKASEFGIIGLEFAFPLLYTKLVLRGRLSLKRLLDCLTENVAKIFKLKTGVIKEKAIADLVLIDLELKERIREEDILSKGKNSPYIGQEVVGIPVLTISRGRIVYDKQEG